MTTSDDLVERVARAICTVDEQNGGAPWDYHIGRKSRIIDTYYDQAKAAIAIALEEAAKVAETRLFNRSCTCGFDAAAAILAMKEDKNE